MGPSDILRAIRDRLRRTVVDPGEQKLLDQLQKLRESERALQAAADAGGQVQDKLEETRAQAADVLGRMPRGAHGLYCALGLLCVLSLEVLTRMYRGFYPMLAEMWGGQDAWTQNWYVQEYRWSSVRIFQLGLLLTSSLWFHVALASFFVALWLVQRKLQRWQARTLMWTLILLHLLVSFVFWLTPFHLLIGPLIKGFR